MMCRCEHFPLRSRIKSHKFTHKTYRGEGEKVKKDRGKMGQM